MVAQWTVNGVDQKNISNELVIPSLTGKTEVAVKFVPYEGFAIPNRRHRLEGLRCNTHTG